MSTLVLDASGALASLAVFAPDGALANKVFVPGRPGLIETLPLLLQEAVQGQRIATVVVITGPGSFTGLRTAISLAQGFAAASGAQLLGVPVADAFRAAFPALQRPLWIAIRARKGRIFLLRDYRAEAFADADIPRPGAPIALAGNAAIDVAARLAARGDDVLLTNARSLDPLWIAQAARQHLASGRPAYPVQPLYIDPPEAKLPASGLRPAPR
ncbi:MAG TPA: tRNA (adenosine(37)-N6)-threonylcarbamoyltransferase complex dimerization subunit type 1 TsaB [Acidocella sp.]|nr:MAG: tRNA (adenosine(37)-N6)-threonylcarbamoyltransferase complex dimerization subunit type 1 TsaB [Acidocella sp. 20-61-6]HQT47263.1 tRNA (adenosine(37)-N6)-threonylcarbamoyltransferase complex dimerization subunit type 1 TsaB [Acidocella sp.]